MINNTTSLIVESILAAGLCLAAAIFDLKYSKIPNKLTFPAIIIGLIMTPFFSGWIELLTSLLFIIVLFFLGMLKFVGLGDIKLIMGVIAIGGYKMGIVSFVFGTIILTAVAFCFNPIETGLYIKKMLNRFNFRKEKINPKSSKYKFAPFILIGLILYVLFVDNRSPIYYGTWTWFINHGIS